MRIALCLEYPIAMRGGVSVLVETLLEEFSRRGHEVVLVSNDPPGSLQGSPTGRLIRQHISWQTVKPTRAQSRQLAGELVAAGVGLAHFHLGGNFGFGNRLPFRSPIYFLSRRGVPCVSTTHLVINLLAGYCGPQKPFWFKALLLPLAWWGKMQQLRHVRCEIAVSRHDLEKMQRWYWPLRGRFVQIYHSRLRNEPEPPANSNRAPLILNVGHVALRKGQLVLAEAFAQVAGRFPDWTLQLAGHDDDGIATEKIRQLARDRRLEDRIQLLGRREDALALMRRAAIYVQPSFWEALGLALQEAMACGCACIGSRVGGIPELITENETGLLFAPGNTGQLSLALERLMADAGQRENFSRAAAGFIRASGMTVEDMVQRHLRLYEKILPPD
jgi:glycosyltransferase involved in cell wall biosynthesis